MAIGFVLGESDPLRQPRRDQKPGRRKSPCLNATSDLGHPPGRHTRHELRPEKLPVRAPWTGAPSACSQGRRSPNPNVAPERMLLPNGHRLSYSRTPRGNRQQTASAVGEAAPTACSSGHRGRRQHERSGPALAPSPARHSRTPAKSTRQSSAQRSSLMALQPVRAAQARKGSRPRTGAWALCRGPLDEDLTTRPCPRSKLQAAEPPWPGGPRPPRSLPRKPRQPRSLAQRLANGSCPEAPATCSPARKGL
mmetsp:Transcript_20697/g.45435  ORF Transcript_20697/g.45435 Transcript_20697/m.45435 type:complete len:251 (-) Transcript_20697:1445-2197(-)